MHPPKTGGGHGAGAVSRYCVRLPVVVAVALGVRRGHRPGHGPEGPGGQQRAEARGDEARVVRFGPPRPCGPGRDPVRGYQQGRRGTPGAVRLEALLVAYRRRGLGPRPTTGGTGDGIQLFAPPVAVELGQRSQLPRVSGVERHRMANRGAGHARRAGRERLD